MILFAHNEQCIKNVYYKYKCIIYVCFCVIQQTPLKLSYIYLNDIQ